MQCHSFSNSSLRSRYLIEMLSNYKSWGCHFLKWWYKTPLIRLLYSLAQKYIFNNITLFLQTFFCPLQVLSFFYKKLENYNIMLHQCRDNRHRTDGNKLLQHKQISKNHATQWVTSAREDSKGQMSINNGFREISKSPRKGSKLPLSASISLSWSTKWY